MTNEIDFSEWNPDRLETDGEDLMRTIYAYFCNNGYPHKLQDAIDTVIQILATEDNTHLEMDCLLQFNETKKQEPLTSCMVASKVFTIT